MNKECVLHQHKNKMKNFIFFIFILFIIAGIGGIKAVGYSPSSLIYKLNVGEEQCKMININSDSEKITLSDKWAENKDAKWDVNLFQNNSGYHSIKLKYPKTLGKEEKEAKICIKGDKTGEYHGVLLLKEEQKGNSIIQVGIWIKANIDEKVQNQTQENKGFWTITGNTIGAISKKMNVIYIIGTLAVLIAAGIIFKLNKKKDPWKC